MSNLGVIALVSACVVCVGWLWLLARVFRTTRAMQRLPTTSISGTRRRITAVLAARNERACIAHTVHSLLGQCGVAIDVIVVDDGSADGTLEILQAMAKEHDRLTVLENKKCPLGWVAKNYALELGQGHAEGDFILFTDADVICSSRALFHATELMEQQQLDHLAVHPRLEAGTFVEALVLPLYFLLSEWRFIDPRATQPASGVGAGIGAFNLVRSESYRLRGTHARIRGTVLDGRALGRLMRTDGGRGNVVRAVTQVRMRPYQSFSDIYVGIRKGALSAVGNSAFLTGLSAILLLIAALGPIAAVALSATQIAMGEIPWGGFLAIAALVLPTAGLLRIRSLVRFEPAAAFFYPAAALVISACALHAAVVFGIRGKITWRGRSYSRAALKTSLEEMW